MLFWVPVFVAAAFESWGEDGGSEGAYEGDSAPEVGGLDGEKGAGDLERHGDLTET